MTIANVSSTLFIIAIITTYPIKAVQGELTHEFRELTKDSIYWRFMLIAPVCFSVLSGILSFFIIKSDSPKALISKGKTEEAFKAIK
jgi:capsular polysaccharide biosynthesis protein